MLKWKFGGVLLWSLLLFAAAAFSLPVTFGAEFTFYHPKRSWGVVRSRMMQHLLKDQPKGEQFSLEYCLGTQSEKSEKFVSPNGWWFAIERDQGGVAEVKTIPAHVEYYRHYESDMQDAIFASAATEGFFPALYLGGGHINIGLQELAKNPLLLRNFIVDLINHNELFLGIFNYDTNNALSFSLYDSGIRLYYREIIEDFDQGRITDPYRLLAQLNLVQKGMYDVFQRAWDNKFNRLKSFAVNFTHAKEGPKGRIEIRAVRPQAGMDAFIRQIDLFQHRIDYLERLDKPIPIAPLVPLVPTDLWLHKLSPPVSAQLALRSFYKYVRESRLKWQDHRDYLWPGWMTGGELKRFESSVWFQWQERRGDCEAKLGVGNG